MRHSFTLLILICWTVSQAQKLNVTVTIDTFNLDFNGYLRKAVLFRDNFYCMFESKQKNTTQLFKKMVVVSPKGEFVEDVFVPREIQNMPHYDLIVDNDSLYVKESQFKKANFVLGEYVADLKLSKTKEFKVFKDEDYNIYSTCNGEWGGTIFFQNLKKKENYEAASTCPIVINKIDSTYYVTNYIGHMQGFASVLKIPNPEKLEKSNLNFQSSQGSNFRSGIESLIDTIGFYIATSFVWDKKLLHLYSDNQGTYIGQIDNKKIQPIFKFSFKFYSHFNQQLADGQQILTCYFPDDKKNGILLLSGGRFSFYKFK